jgi:hypothetical protein
MAKNSRVPAALMIDDGAPVNLMVWHCTWEEHVKLVPNRLAADFAAMCERHGVMGKFSLPPMPAALGRIDRSLIDVSEAHRKGFLKIVHGRIAPRFDITPELTTHLTAYTPTDFNQHVWEDAWVAQASADEIADYVALSLKMLIEAGFKPNGVTSPWDTGSTNEDVYAEGVCRAIYRVQRRKSSWYFRAFAGDQPLGPFVKWRDKKRGLKIVSVPVNAGDVFWHTQYGTAAQAKRVAQAGVDQFLSADGKTGRIRELVDAGMPVTLATHWQSLFSNGRMAGLAGLKLLLDRISKHFGDRIEWKRCSELAKRALR